MFVVKVGGSDTRSHYGHLHRCGHDKCARFVKVGRAMTSSRCVRVHAARLYPRQALKRPKPFCGPTHSDRLAGSRVSSGHALLYP